MKEQLEAALPYIQDEDLRERVENSLSDPISETHYDLWDELTESQKGV